MAKTTTTTKNNRIDFFKDALGKNTTLHNTFEKLYNAKKGDWPAIAKVLQKNKNFSAVQVKNLSFTHELANWTGDNKTLVTLFQKNNKTNSLRDIALTLNKNDLSKLVTSNAVPKGETKAAYIGKLYNDLYQNKPTEVITNIIKDPNVPLLNNKIGKNVTDLLAKHPDFNIRTTSVYKLINNKNGFLEKLPDDERKQTITELKKLSLATCHSPIPEAIPVLINRNLVTNHAITQLPRSQFMAAMNESGLTMENLSHIYDEAEKRKVIIEQNLIKIKEAGLKTGISMIDGKLIKGELNNPKKIDPEVKDYLAKNNLSWDLLFGDADYYACDEDTSVYSAAAYFVDLLQYLRNNNIDKDSKNWKYDAKDITGTPLEKLFARRPDLGNLELTGKNTNTILPYVDLVNEVMEQYVAFKANNKVFRDYRGFNVGDETSGELLSAPQHTEQDYAYQTLSEAVFPFTLPYHQPIDAARLFLNYLKSSRYELIETFHARSSGNNIDYLAAAEFLGLTEKEYCLITKEYFDGTATSYQTYEYYGLPNAKALNKLSHVKKELLPRTGLLYTELIDILKTQYINPASNNPISLISTIANGNLDDVTLGRKNGQQLGPIEYGRLHRFIRLWRKLGFTIDETDKAIMASGLGNGDITSVLIKQLASVKKIMNRTGIDLTKLLCFWGDISTVGENSLYQRLFLNHNLVALDKVFDTDITGTGNPTISEHLPVIMAALNLSADDIVIIQAYKSIPDKLTISNLSMLYRFRLLSKTLGIRIPALIKILPVFGDVFEDAAKTLQFLENWDKAEEAGFTPDQLNYIITDTDNDNKPLTSKKDVLVFTKQIYDGLNSIELEQADLTADDLTASPEDQLKSIEAKATDEFIRSKASLLYESPVVEQIISILDAPNVFQTTAPANLDIAWPVPNILQDKVAYNQSTGILNITGVLNAAETDAFNNLQSASEWGNSLSAIIQIQTDQVYNMQSIYRITLSGIFGTTDQSGFCAIGEPASKRLTFIKGFLPYLRQELASRLIIEAVSTATTLDKNMLQTLITFKNGSVSIYDSLAAVKKSSYPHIMQGYLMPQAETDYTFIFKSVNIQDIKLCIDGAQLNFSSRDTNGDWWTDSVALKAGSVNILVITGGLLNNILWKTALTNPDLIDSSQLLPQDAFDCCSSVLNTLKKVALLLGTFKLSPDEINCLQGNIDFGSLDFYNLGLTALLRIADYCSLRDSLPQSSINILQLWNYTHDTTSDDRLLSREISALTCWNSVSVDKLINNFNLSKADFKNEQNLIKLKKALDVASKLGLGIDKLFEWADPTADFATCKTVSDSIQKAIRAQYNQTDWEQVVKPLNDQLRNNQKNALIAYLLQQPELKTAGVSDADGLFEYFLIDVQMDACMETSRIKQAISSVQLFIQRCFLGLEEYIQFDIDARDRWKWMERYRVWEANRKVFLYPENWIESNLRDDKSPFFKELESELLQKDINKQNVTDALKNYLYKVDGVANMEVIGIFIEGDKKDDFNWNDGAKLHVFSRTRSAPYFFYYRYMALDEVNWYPWEKVQVDIPSYDVDIENSNGQITGNGCYLIPIIWKKRLLIFFPQITKKTKPKDTQSSNDKTKQATIAELAGKTSEEIIPDELWEVKIAWSEYRNGKWTQKQLGKDAVATNPKSQEIDIQFFKFVPFISEDNILLSFDELHDYDGGFYKTFCFDGNKIDLYIDVKNYPDTIIHPSAPNFFNKQISNQVQLVQTYQYTDDYNEYLKRNNIRFSDYQLGTAVSFSSWSTFNFSDSKIKELIWIADADEFYNLPFTTNDNCEAFGKSMCWTDTDSSIYHELKRSYSLYNWELFFHTPIMLADALSKSQQFEEAMKWFNYVFNPLADGIDDKRFWQFIPFKEINSKNILEQIFNNLGANKSDEAISEWRNKPFQPHVVARSRPVAYMKWVVMKYLDNIIEWGDYLFRQDTIESINQAIQLYVLAGHILGPKPMIIPPMGEIKAQTYKSLLDKWDAFSNAMTELELADVYSIQPVTAPIDPGKKEAPPTTDIFALYFSIPNNPKLLAYWDRLADRLFKIRHSQNIEGVFRKLPLFEPPIDPALLVQAAAQGLSISSVMNDLNTAMPNYRFYYLLQKALELCNELKSMGGAILSAIEKKDNESISLIRSRHEGTMNDLVMEIKKLQLDESQKSIDSLKQNRIAPEARMKYYLKLLGEEENKMPGMDTDFEELANNIEMPEDYDDSGLKLNKFENEEMKKAFDSIIAQTGASLIELVASCLHGVPDFSVNCMPMGVGITTQTGGSSLGNVASHTAKSLQIVSSVLSYQSSSAQRKGNFQRALQERIQQANAAGYELKQIDKQITAQLIRRDIANQEILNQQKQIDNANEIEEFLKNKYTNEELYTWMRSSLKTLYHQVYNLAYDLAKKAEKTYCFERGVSNAGFIQAGYFDAGREGLLAGEQLYLGLKQLEAAYQEKRGYDYEITKHISLRQLDPLALLQLKTESTCEFDIPEILFDMDFPGHFKRRIKSVSISIPCIAGPYTGVNATLRLLNNKFRNIAITNKYPDAADESFISYNIPITAIATSSAQNDAGMFELNFKDERYLPFEGAGVISRWRIELPSGFQQFDYNTISDVIMHLRYTSVDGGDNLKKSAAGTVQDFVKSNVELSEREGLFALFDLKNDFPNEYYKFTQTPPSNDKIAFNLGNLSERLPIFTKNYTISAADATLWITSDLKSDKVICPLSSSMDHWTLQIDNKGITSLDRIWLIVRYTLSKKLK